MSLYPRDKAGTIGYFRSKVAPWTTNATAIGTTSAAVTAMDAKVDAAQAKLDAKIAAHEAAKNATAALDTAVDELIVAGMDIVRQIRAKAEIDGNGVYTLAEIPAPATPGPIGPLGTPTEFGATFDGAGGLNLKWKCTNPKNSGGTVYQVWRRVGGVGEFSFLGNAGGKRFLDTTIPAGSSQVTYQVRAIRSTSAGEWAQFNVNFGTSSSGAMTASVVQTPVEPKLAA
jgi:hypothetical protein